MSIFASMGRERMRIFCCGEFRWALREYESRVQMVAMFSAVPSGLSGVVGPNPMLKNLGYFRAFLRNATEMGTRREHPGSITNSVRCRIYGVRRQAKRDAALEEAGGTESTKAPSPLRSAGALHRIVNGNAPVRESL
jgi:hypothetical protein